MKTIECPNCHTVFTVDESDYAAIVAQVKSAEFDSEVERRLHEIAAARKTEEEKRQLQAERVAESLRAEIAILKGKIENFDTQKKLELSDLRAANDAELTRLKSSQQNEIANLRAEIANNAKERELAVIKEQRHSEEALRHKEEEITRLQTTLSTTREAAMMREADMKAQFEKQLSDKQELIDYYKEFKARLSTKMIGESLEVHCATTFNKVRIGMYPNAYFEKDNDARTGSKGDFIFRDYVDGYEYISIMFEMKNEMDTTATKHRNEDFFEKLDKDRREKGCEYAVLVSLLEADNEYYNEGITDVSYRYPKMYVVRPQFFMPLISMLCTASRKSVDELNRMRHELEIARAQSVDVTKFEEKLDRFRLAFGKNVQAAHKKFGDAMGGIDKIIEGLEGQIKKLREVKSMFEASDQKLLRADEAVEEDLTIKKLTHGNPTMRAKFEEARKAAQNPEH